MGLASEMPSYLR